MINKKICVGVAVALAIAMSLVSPVIAATSLGTKEEASANLQLPQAETLAQLNEELNASIQEVDLFFEQKACLDQQLLLLQKDPSTNEVEVESYIGLVTYKLGASKELQKQLVALTVEYNRLARELGKDDQQLLQEIGTAVQQLDQGWVKLSKENYTMEQQVKSLQTLLDELSNKPLEPLDPDLVDKFTPPVEEEPEIVTWVVPVTGYYISSPFGMRMHPILGYQRMHNGIDMACVTGTEIRATRAGKVIRAQWSDSAGYYVQIDHGDGFVSEYMHMTKYVVSVGDSVAAGQLIGFVGSTGLSDGSHLHFGISFEGGYVDPLKYVKA